ncbi:hypothetical protein [Haladaptatus sp. ZSTT2]|uniref:hypothetical protein n=1 Tax=Haladaptatus sp. ZSTT2 TaxID=3120515 RepID=UPI00300F7948
MADEQTTFALLELVALVLPAVAIYLEIPSSRHDLSQMDDGIAANYHAIRLTFGYLLFAGFTLIIALLIPDIGQILNQIALCVLAISLLTFGLPVVFSRVGLSNPHSILYPYMNTYHRISDTVKKFTQNKNPERE